MFLGKGFYMCTVRNSRAGQIEAAQEYRNLFQSEVYIKKFLSETYTECYLSKNTIKDFVNIVGSFLQFNPKTRLNAKDAISHPFLVTQDTGKVMEILDTAKQKVSTVEQDGSLMQAVGPSKEVMVSLLS